jgi:hypothetical protein
VVVECNLNKFKMIKFMIVVLFFVGLISCNRFFDCIETCGRVLDEHDSTKETEVTLDTENYCEFMQYLQKFREHSRFVTNYGVGNKYIENYSDGKVHGITCLQRYVNNLPVEELSVADKEYSEECLFGQNICGN